MPGRPAAAGLQVNSDLSKRCELGGRMPLEIRGSAGNLGGRFESARDLFAIDEPNFLDVAASAAGRRCKECLPAWAKWCSRSGTSDQHRDQNEPGARSVPGPAGGGGTRLARRATRRLIHVMSFSPLLRDATAGRAVFNCSVSLSENRRGLLAMDCLAGTSSRGSRDWGCSPPTLAAGNRISTNPPCTYRENCSPLGSEFHPRRPPGHPLSPHGRRAEDWATRGL